MFCTWCVLALWLHTGENNVYECLGAGVRPSHNGGPSACGNTLNATVQNRKRISSEPFYTKNNHCYQDRPGTNLERKRISQLKTRCIFCYRATRARLKISWRAIGSSSQPPQGRPLRTFRLGLSLSPMGPQVTQHTHTRQTKGRRETEPNVDCSFALLLKDRFFC